MLLAPQHFTSLRIGDKNMWYGGGPCGSQSLWCLPLSSPPYILDNLPCSLVCLASKPQRSTCLPQHYDPSISRISAPGALPLPVRDPEHLKGLEEVEAGSSAVCVTFPLLLPGENGNGHTAATVVIHTAASKPLFSLAVTTWAEWGTLEESLVGYPTE